MLSRFRPRHQAPTITGQRTVGQTGRTVGSFRMPYGIAAFPDGSLAIGDVHNERIQVLAPDGTVQHVWGSRGFSPTAIAPSGNQHLWVADSSRNRVTRFSLEGDAVSSLSDPAGFRQPSGIATSDDGRIAVADSGNRRVVVFDPDGSPTLVLGADNLLGEPVGVCFDRLGQLVVADRATRQLVRFGVEPDYPDVMDLGLLPGTPAAPWGVIIDSAGRIMVSLVGTHRILVLAPDGQLLGTWSGDEAAIGSLLEPTCLAFHGSETLIVADTYNDRLVIATVI